MSEPSTRPRYVLVTSLMRGRDNDEFNQRVNDALAQGYQLCGSPVLVDSSAGIVAAQAMILPPRAFTDAFPPEMRRMMGMPE